MPNKKSKQVTTHDDEMQAEYDLSSRKGQRGRYYDALQQGYTVRIHEDDGTTTVQHYKLEEGAVLLDPDVREYFPDAKAVNAALRALIALIPNSPARRRRSSDAAAESRH